MNYVINFYSIINLQNALKKYSIDSIKLLDLQKIDNIHFKPADLFHDEAVSRCKCEDNRIHGYLAPAVEIKKGARTNEITMDWEALRGITPVSLD